VRNFDVEAEPGSIQKAMTRTFQLIADLGCCLVVNKPGGVLTQAPPAVDSLEVRIRKSIQLSGNSAAKIYLGVPHRLDRPVSGAMVFARNVRAAGRIAQQFRDRTVEKTYWAIVEGTVEPERGRWIDFMKKLPDESKSVAASPNDPAAQEAILDYRRIACNGTRSWLEIELQTGRTHQIRLQTSYRGYPIIGDELYGSTAVFGPQTNDRRLRWIALHARELAFDHPVKRDRHCFQAELWPCWQDLGFELPA
jgi:RluA family pseudouridine synthase